MMLPSQFSLLVVDDEPDLRTLYELTLLREGYEVETASCVDDAWAQLGARQFSAVITDLRLPDGTGLDLLRRLEAQGRPEKTIVITAFGSSDNAVEALKAGAFDYLTKPVDLRQFRSVVASALGRIDAVVSTIAPTLAAAKAVEPQGARASQAFQPKDPREPAPMVVPASTAFARMVGHSPAIEQIRAMVEKVARSMAPVLIDGESGTGKELVAKSIHEIGVRAAQPFIAVNCGAIPEQLLEAEFFGYRKGAFTGANEDRGGFFQAAHGGTLFLDEIGDLPLSMQSKLLRCIQERAVRPVGAVAELPVSVRLLSATNKDLAAEVQAGRFRQDLFYRLNVIQIRVPPLRERGEDLPEISAQILARLGKDSGPRHLPRLTHEALVQLSRYSFPGNVRELENLLHRAVALASDHEITPFDLGLQTNELPTTEAHRGKALPVSDQPLIADTPIFLAGGIDLSGEDLPNDLQAHLDQVERVILLKALARFGNNRTAAGASMGLSLRQMRYRMARLHVTVGGESPAEGDADRDRDLCP
jgi:two-component system response regulator PilR (NtrC family)